MYPNPLKQKIRDGKLVLGTMLPTHDIRIAAALAYGCHADFIWLDQEHSPFGPADMEMIPILLRQQGVAPLVRVAWNDPALIKKAYDGGAVSVMVPQVASVAEAKQAIQYGNYPPIGNRGISPSWPALAGEDFVEVVKTANDEAVLILQMESVEAYEQIDDILALDGFDVLFVGPWTYPPRWASRPRCRTPGCRRSCATSPSGPKARARSSPRRSATPRRSARRSTGATRC